MNDFNTEKTLIDFSSPKKNYPCPLYIGPYKIEGILKQGGMSLLYLATHPNYNKTLVIKVLLPKYLKNKEIIDRFLNEAKIINIANHPNIVKLYGQGKWEMGLYIAMEFIQGVSLKQFILQKSLSKKKALQIVLQVAYALCHLHTHGIIHRDLKPENIIITESGDIKVIDFGIAQLHDKEQNMAQEKRLAGTPVYMSPEQIESPGKVSYYSDIFSLGIIAYELFIGRLSYGVIQLSFLPKGLRYIIEKALKVNIVERYQDIVEFITDISQYCKEFDETKEESTNVDEWADEFYKIQKKLFFKQKYNISQLDVNLVLKKQISLIEGIYLDFFNLTSNQCLFILAETKSINGISSIINMSILKGIILSEINEVNEINLVDFVTNLNKIVFRQFEKERFLTNFILFDKVKNQCFFISCKHNDILFISNDNNKINNFSTSLNIQLGATEEFSFSVITNNWNFKDKILISSLGLSNSKDKELNNIVTKELNKNIDLPIKEISQKLINKINTTSKNPTEKRSNFIISIERTY